jgi:hypothetical protein
VACLLQQPGRHQPGRAGTDDQHVLGPRPSLGRQSLLQDASVAGDEGAIVGVQYQERVGYGETPVEIGVTAVARSGRRGQGRGGTAVRAVATVAVPAAAAKLRRDRPPSERTTE